MSTDDIAANLEEILTSLRELESLEQERRPVAALELVVDHDRDVFKTLVVCSDGSLWGEANELASGWQELRPIPGTRRARELESPTPADYSPALDGTTALAAVVEAAQKVLPRLIEGHWQVPIREQPLVLELEAALAALERQQETEGRYTCRKCSARMEHAGNYGYCEDCEGGGDE